MPAGASLISPWVDLTHSFKSIMGDDSGDYIPSEGFHVCPMGHLQAISAYIFISRPVQALIRLATHQGKRHQDRDEE